jgi:hypothetical protein
MEGADQGAPPAVQPAAAAALASAAAVAPAAAAAPMDPALQAALEAAARAGAEGAAAAQAPAQPAPPEAHVPHFALNPAAADQDVFLDYEQKYGLAAYKSGTAIFNDVGTRTELTPAGLRPLPTANNDRAINHRWTGGAGGDGILDIRCRNLNRLTKYATVDKEGEALRAGEAVRAMQAKIDRQAVALEAVTAYHVIIPQLAAPSAKRKKDKAKTAAFVKKMRAQPPPANGLAQSKVFEKETIYYCSKHSKWGGHIESACRKPTRQGQPSFHSFH